MKDPTPLEKIRADIESQGGKIDLSALSQALGVDYNALRRQFGEDETTLPARRQERCAKPKDIRTLGRRGFQRYVIAIKHTDSDWPIEYHEALVVARRMFDAGTHEMFQTVRCGWVVQYCIPRRRPVAPRNYFRSQR